MKKKKLRHKRVIDVPTADYQPSVAEQKEEFDMPKATLSKIRKAFFRPFEFRKKS